ncbi:MCE family protein [Mycobacterium sp.]|uniref:MCE family protein n=1 Tax=Mycobacterium sp. TaxID=1785 RepID=UPI002C9FB63D|nr:MCE family protein [Mycobacterium sp.]HKP43003.1 MCE family protein [Mycobacterium sp.]
MNTTKRHRLHPAWWALLLVALVAVFLFATLARFTGTFDSMVPVVLTSDRAGLVMEPDAKVKLRGVQVGKVSRIRSADDSVRLNLEIYPDQLKYIPANVAAQIRATTVFGAKYVDLIYPDDPSPKRLAAGAVIKSQNVTSEVNTVFQNLVGLLKQIDPAKLNAVLAAFSEGLRGQGQSLGEAITDANQVLLELNPRSETIRRDWRSLKGFSDTYSAAAKNIMTVLDAASTTSTTVTSHAAELDALLLNIIGLSHSGITLFGPNKDNFVHGVNDLEPTTALLLKYNPEYTCTLVGAHKSLTDYHLYDVTGGNGFSGVSSASVVWGHDPYRYPDNLPIIGAKGGPGGKPGCGSLPDVSKNFPVRQLVTNTGFGTGMDWRPNPGIGFPGWANYFPVTRAVPEPPSIRYLGGPAPGPAPAYPGGPPYGAPWYAPDGTPLFPGLPPGVPSDSPPPDPSHPPPGAQPPAPPVAPPPSQPAPLASDPGASEGPPVMSGQQ